MRGHAGPGSGEELAASLRLRVGFAYGYRLRSPPLLALLGEVLTVATRATGATALRGRAAGRCTPRPSRQAAPGLRGYLGLGSNLGDRLANLRSARDALAAERDVDVLASSSVYETEPQGEVTDQPDFLNACLRIETELAPEALLDRAKAVERALGGERHGPPDGPRVLDIDLLLLGDGEHCSDRLTLPHPETTSRRFVLVPLLELEPGLELPDGTRLADSLSALEGQRVERVGPL